jgi:hypothetical protein
MKEKYGDTIKTQYPTKQNYKSGKKFLDPRIIDINSAILQDLKSKGNIVFATPDAKITRNEDLKIVGDFKDKKTPKGKAVHHFLPLAGIEGESINLASTKNTAVIDKKLNSKMAPFDKKLKANQKEQINLLQEKPPGYERRMEELNYKAKNIYKEAGKKVPGSKGYLGYTQINVNPDGTYTSKVIGMDKNKSLAGLEGEEILYKNISKEEKAKVKNLIENAPKLKAALLPGLEEIVKGIKNIPDDIAKKRYFTLGLKALGPLGTYLAVDDTYEALKEGKSVAEALEYGLIGTNIIGSTKDVFALSPEEREARSVVKQAEMADQISQDESLLDTDFETPAIESDLSVDEAEKKYKAGQEAVRLKREAQEADIARARAVSVKELKDLMMGERFQPQQIPTQFMANGGIMRLGFAEGGDPKDPKMNRRTFMKVMGGLASIPLLGKFIKPAAKVVESAAPVVKENLASAPDHFWNLVNKIKLLGDDVTRTGALAERQSVKQYKDFTLVEDTATGQIDIQRMKLVDDVDAPSYYGNPLTEETYMSYRPGKGQMDETMKGKTPPDDYEEGTAYLRTDREYAGEIVDEVSGVSDDIFEEAGVPVPEAVRKGFADGSDPKDPKMNRRTFMKVMGGLASIPLLGKFIKPAAKVVESAAPAIQRSVEGVPEFLMDLIAKVKLKAKTEGYEYFTGNKPEEFKDVYKVDNYVVTEKGNKTIIREIDQDGDMLYKENQMELDYDPETGGYTYKEASARPDGEGKLKDVEEYIEDDDLENMRKYTYDK